MPRYDYKCTDCNLTEEYIHSISKTPRYICPICSKQMERLISGTFHIAGGGIKESLDDHKESEHKKKVKDPERAVRSRKKAFGHDAVGDPKMTSDPRHIVKRGRTLGGQQTEIDRQEFIKAAAKSDFMVDQAKKALKKNQKN